MEDSPLLSNIQQFQNHIADHGLHNLKQVAKTYLENISHEPLHIAVLGTPNQHKENFINTFPTYMVFGSLGYSGNTSRQATEGSIHSGKQSNDNLRRGFNTSGLSPVGKIGCVDQSIVSKSHDVFTDKDEGVYVSDEEIDQLSSPSFQWTPSAQSFQYLQSDIVLHDITDTSFQKFIGKRQSYGFDVFIVYSASRFINDDMLKWMKLYRNERHVIFINSCLDQDETTGGKSIHGNISNDHKTVHRYYRQKLFRHCLWNIPIYFISNSDPDANDYPDLLKQISKIQKRKLRQRRRLLRAAAIEAIPQKKFQRPGKTLSLISAFASSEHVLPYPVLPATMDLVSALSRWYNQRKYFEIEDILDPNDDIEVEYTPKYVAKQILEKAPAVSTWCLQRFISNIVSFVFDDSVIRSLIVGAGSILGYHLSMRSGNAHSAKSTRDAKWCINTTMNSSLSDGFMAFSAASSRASSRRSSIHFSRAVSPTQGIW